jgi:hypothetical protein
MDRSDTWLTVNPAITYGVFERLKAVVLAREGRIGGRLSVGESFWIGVGSKTLATVVTYPYIFVSRPRGLSTGLASFTETAPAKDVC